MKKLTISLIITTSICASPFALADTNNTSWNEHVGPYVEANAGTNLVYLGVFSSNGNESNAGIYGFGYSVDAGYNFTKYFALEAGFMQNYIDFNQYVDSSDKASSLRQHSNIPYGAMKFILPIGERATFFGKAGVMYANADNQSIVLPYTGVGFGYAVTKNVEVTAQYQGAIYGVAGAGLLSGGVTYHFG